MSRLTSCGGLKPGAIVDIYENQSFLLHCKHAGLNLFGQSFDKGKQHDVKINDCIAHLVIFSDLLYQYISYIRHLHLHFGLFVWTLVVFFVCVF